MLKQLRALAVLAEDPGSIPSNHMSAYNLLQFQKALFWLLWVLHTCGAHKNMQAKHPHT